MGGDAYRPLPFIANVPEVTLGDDSLDHQHLPRCGSNCMHARATMLGRGRRGRLQRQVICQEAGFILNRNEPKKV